MIDRPKLPKLVELDGRGHQLVQLFNVHKQMLWARGTLEVPVIKLTPPLSAALKSAHTASQLVRGLEAAERTLAAEDKGLRQVDNQSRQQRGERVSRLCLLAGDGGSSFYRKAEKLVVQHSPRLLAIKLDAEGEQLGAAVYGPTQLARCLMLNHKQAVARVLLSLLES